MPYIKGEDRIEVIRYGPRNAGELNFALTRLIVDYYLERGKDYQAINDIVGALVGCKDEFTRRVVHRFENAKLFANGDVFDKIV